MTKLLLDVLRGNPVTTPPVWIMRQAGRYLPEYRKVRERYEFMEMCKNPEIAAEVTLQPIEIFSMDGAILFSDILLVCEAMGMELEFVDGKGPLFRHPLRNLKDIESLRAGEACARLGYVFESVRLVDATLPTGVTLIGFAGAPFTLACYMVEGNSSRDHVVIKALMYREDRGFRTLMEKLSQVLVDYLRGQVNAGAEVVMLFDTFGGILSPTDYRRYAFPHVTAICKSLKESHPATPIIYFAKNGFGLYSTIKDLAVEAIGVDWTVSLSEAIANTGNKFTVQGNLDPAVLLAGHDVIEREAKRVLKEGQAARGHIFNLGHGILPGTPVENVKRLLEVVRCRS